MDDAGRLVQKRYPSGVTTRYDWNPDNSLKQVSHQNGAAILAQSTYGYDGFGQRNSVSETLAGLGTLNTAYGYDNLNRLIGVDNGNPAQRESYSYDPLGNRVLKQVGGASTAYVYDNANQLLETHAGSLAGPLSAAFVYDNAGNLTQSGQGVGVTRTATSCTGSTSTTLGWDSFNQLAQVNGASSASYVYDDQGRRIQKTEGAITTAYVYDGQNIHGEYPDWGAPQAVYAHALGLDHPLSRITGATNLPTATAAYYHEDGLGSLLATSNAAGTVTASQRFGAFGNPVAQSGFGYTGREPDASGLMYYRARYYDPGIGRFISRDPIGLAGGINRYAYVGSNPINFNDPEGLLVNQVSNAFDAGKTYFSNNPGVAADIGVGFTPAGVYADIYGAATGKTLFGGQDLSGWERGLGLIPGVSELAGVVRGVNKVDNIVYGQLDNLGRPTGVSATITQDMIGTGTKANQSIIPPGYVQDEGLARGHLLGAQLGGSGADARNLVTIQQAPANTPVIRGYETQVRNAAEQGETIHYSSTPIYHGENSIPCGITLSATGSNGTCLNVTVLNPPGK
ncbi:MAG: DNA/RNA non-specific endonuclease [Methylococcaceae bacterium]|nr:DNA/RNA non-specific endonuclease [Methylococcaceae bacterium]